MMTFLATVHIIACLILIGLVLIQDSKGGGVFSSQGSSNSVLGATGATTLAQTATKVISLLLAATCIGLAIMSAQSKKSIIDLGTAVPAATAPATSETAEPAKATAPATETAPATNNTAEPVKAEKK